MGKRRKAREAAIQCLYQWDMTGEELDSLLGGYWELHSVAPEVREFAELLVRGAVGHVDELDERIRRQAEHWRLERIGRVERGILRLGVYELLHEPDTPGAVVIDEAVELSKRFCGPEAGQFVNGILDGVHHHLTADSGPPELTHARPSPPADTSRENNDATRNALADSKRHRPT